MKNILLSATSLFCFFNFSFAQIDLIIQTPNASPATVAAGNAVSSTCYIYNQGSTSASASNVGYYLSADAVWDAGDTYLTYSSGGTLGASTSAYKSLSITIPGGTTPGSYNILYYADYSNVVSESIETNNVSAFPITVVASVIDLVIQSQSASPSTVPAGSNVSASCYIYNQGTNVASASNVGYYLSADAVWDAGDTYLTYSSGGSLNPSTSSLRSATLTIPGGTTPGSYYILFYADYSNVVSESVETNNVASVAISVVASVIDLVVQSQSATPSTVPAGSTVSASCNIYNQGNTAASTSNVGYYLSTDAVWDAGDTYLNYSSGGSLAALTSSARSSSLLIPGGTSPGSYYILFFADYSNVVVESVETNNVAVSALTVVAPVMDLVIQSQSTNPTIVPAGATTSAVCNIYNQGNIAVSASNVGYYISADAVWDAGDTYLNYASGGALNPNTSAARNLVVTIPGGTTPGSYYLLFFADYSNVVVENVETNNVNAVAITVVAPTVDLVIQSQTTNPLTIVAGLTTSASCYAYNQGNSTAATSNVGYYLSADALWDAGDVYLNYTSGGSLAASTSSLRSATLTIPGGTTPGGYYLLFYADYSGLVTENVESNNVSYVSITVVAPTIDLVVQSQSATPLTVAAGSTTGASCYAYNQGNSTATTSNVGYYLSADAVWDAGDVFLTFSSGGSLAASTSSYRSATLTIPGGTTPGTYSLLFYADYSGLVAESNESNNVSSLTLTVVAPVIDLVIQSQTANPLSIAAGGTTNASCYIYNQGNTAASSSSVGYYLSSDATWGAGDVFLASSTGGSLAASTSSLRSSTLTIPGGTPVGAYYILYFADENNTVSESIETNNVASVPISVVAPTVDLIIQSQTTSPTTIFAGNSTSASCYIYNQGNSPASSSNVGFYLSTDATWDAADVYLTNSTGFTLNASASAYRSATLTIPGATAPGTYYILYFADYSGAVSEVVETNNVASVLITVTTPTIDLIIQSQSASPTTIVAGNTSSISCYIYNQGNSTSSSSNVGYYLSSNTTWDAADVYLNFSSGGSLNASTSSYRSSVVTIPGATTPGPYYILYYADYAGVISESVETNNVAYVAVTIATPAIDLVIQSQSASPTTVFAGNNITTFCTIYNQGNTAASSSNVGYYLSTDAAWDAADVYLSFSSGSTLGALSSFNYSPSVTIPAATAPGTYYVLYFADYSGVVTESNELNNVSSATITVTTPSIDLIIQTPTIASATVSAGGNVAATCIIRNQGNSTASSSNVGYYLSADTIWNAADVYLTNSAGGALNASSNASKNAVLTIPANTSPGAYYVLYYADYSALVSETVETNNVSNKSITITPFTNIIQMPQTGSNQYTICSGTIYDDGGTSSYSNSANGVTTLNPSTAGNKIRLVFNAFSVETCCDNLKIYDGPNTAAPLLGTYISSPGTITSTHASGALTLVFTSDGSVNMAGFDATISCISVGAFPDLSTINPLCNPGTVPQGSTATVTCQALNSGTDTSGVCITGYYLSSDTIWTVADLLLSNTAVPAILPTGTSSQTTTITIPVSTPVGPYYILFVSDTANAVVENIETNNVTWLAINVSLVISVGSVENGDNMAIYPNPSAGSFNFVFDSPVSGTAVIRIYDHLGQLKKEFTQDVAAGSQSRSVHSLDSKGLYLAEVRIGQRTWLRKIVIQ